MENATYPVIVEKKGKHTILSFPSFDIVTDVEDGADYISAAQEVIALQLAAAEDEEKAARKAGPNYFVMFPDDRPNIKLKKGQQLIYVNVWMPYHRSLVKTVYVRKNVTIPAWVDQLAKANNVNFSEVLTDALKAKLGL